ncbi:hypothetical protein [Microbacterium pumilum]|uniref:Uncharacterized protein n=1 Tax=Microbacterium pumilum TaxID=344165 RepID=A0ABP5DRL3_9MICO
MDVATYSALMVTTLRQTEQQRERELRSSHAERYAALGAAQPEPNDTSVWHRLWNRRPGAHRTAYTLAGPSA